jgi:gluconokinase
MHAARGESVVLACSALKRTYREVLSGVLPVKYVHLTGARELIAARLAARRGHYMPAALLESQFASLEPPEGAIEIDVCAAPDTIADRAVAALRGVR